MINRTFAPEIKPIQKIKFVAPKIFDLKYESKLLLMKEVMDETVKIELQFQAGTVIGDKNAANFVNTLLFSGTKTKSSKEIQLELDQLGAYIDHEISLEKAFVSVYCLRENLEKVIAIVHDAIQHASFEKHELEDVIQEKKQRLQVSLEKVSYLSRKLFQKNLFSSNAAYSRQLELEDFDAIEQKKLIEFHKNHYLNGLLKIVVVSNLEDHQIDLLQTLFKDWSAKEVFTDQVTEFQNNKGSFHFEKAKAVQTAIRIGIPMFNKKHEDYFDFVFLQTILGDYFGSRLMSNIREDKGYTYGIGCSLVELKETGYFVIATEVGKDVCDATLKEIEFEINRLKMEVISDDEIELVKNYLVGQLLKSADGPNAMMDIYLNVVEAGMRFDFYDKYLEAINNMTAEKLQKTANKYLNWSNFTIITAGERN